jgi:hypothetical protein
MNRDQLFKIWTGPNLPQNILPQTILGESHDLLHQRVAANGASSTFVAPGQETRGRSDTP